MKGMLAELLTGFAAPVPAILDTLGPDCAVHVAPIEEVTLDGWSRGSVLLIGDAAHATSPNMAEGAAMALEDGLVLAECLASGRDVTDAAARFQARRRPRTQLGPRPDAPPGSHPQPATRPPQPGAAQMGTEHLPCQLPPASRSPLMMRPCPVQRQRPPQRDMRTREAARQQRTGPHGVGASADRRITAMGHEHGHADPPRAGHHRRSRRRTRS